MNNNFAIYRFKIFYVLAFSISLNIQGQDLPRYMNSSHYEGEDNPDFTRKVERMSKHRAISFNVQGGTRDLRHVIHLLGSIMVLVILIL